MKTSVLILAAGPYKWGFTEKAPKHLVLLAGEPLILRMLRQLKERGYDENVVVVTHNKAIQAAVPRVFVPLKHRFWHETLSSTSALWGDRTVVLNGDTIYSPVALGMILADRSPIMFYGHAGYGNRTPIEAMSFGSPMSERVASAAKTATAEASRKGGMRIGAQWGLYHVLFGLPLRKRNAPGKAFSFLPKGDYTTDVDAPGHHTQFLAKHKWARNPKGAH